MIRKISLGFLLFFVASIILLVTSINFFLETDFSQSIIKNSINNALPGTLSWQKMRLSLFRGMVSAHDVTITGPDSTRYISVEYLSTHISLRALVQKKILLSSPSLTHPEVMLTIDSSGSLDLLSAFINNEGPDTDTTVKEKGFSLILRKAKILHGNLQFSLQKQQVFIKAHDIDIKGSFDFSLTLGTASLSAAACSLSTPGFHGPLTNIAFSADMSGDTLNSCMISTHLGSSSIAVTGAINSLATQPNFNLALNSSVSLQDITTSVPSSPPLSGNASIDMQLQNTVNNPTISCALKITNSIIGSTSVDFLSCKLHGANRQMHIDTVYGISSLGTLAGNGSIDFRKAFPQGFTGPNPDLPALSYRAMVSNYRLALDKVLSKPGSITGILNASCLFEGQGISTENMTATLTGNAVLENFSADSTKRPFDIIAACDASLSEGVASVSRLTAHAHNLDFTGNGTLQIASQLLNSSITCDSIDLASFAPLLSLPGLSGKTAFTVTASGPVTHPTLHSIMKTNTCRINGLTLGSLIMSSSLDSSGTVSVPSLSITNNRSSLTFTGAFGLFKPHSMTLLDTPSIRLSLRADTVQIEDFLDSLAGTFSASADIEGPLHTMAGSYTIRGTELHTGVQNFSDLTLAGRFISDTITVDPIALSLVPGHTIFGSGWCIPGDKKFLATLKADKIPFQALSVFQKRDDFSGLLSCSFSGEGSFGAPIIYGTLSLDALKAADISLDPLSLLIRMEDSVVQAKSTSNYLIEAAYNLYTKSFSTKARFKATELAPYFLIAGQNDFTGTVSGSLDVWGNADSLRRAEAKANLTSMVLNYKNQAIVTTDTCNFSFANQQIATSGINLRLLDKGYISLRGSGTLNGESEISIDGTVPFHLIDLFVPQVTAATGTVSFNGTLRGSLDHPDFSAKATVHDLGCTIDNVSQPIKKCNGSINITPSLLTIDTVHGSIGDGQFMASGTCTLADFQPQQISIVFNAVALPLAVDNMMEGHINTAMTMQGTKDDIAVRGDITMLSWLYYQDIAVNILQNVGKRKRENEPAQQSTNKSPLDAIHYDVTLKPQGPLVIDNNVAKLNITPDLHLSGTFAHPVIDGRATVESGTITYQRKTFTVTKGVLDFSNPYRTEANLDITGTVPIRSWIITLSVSGTLDNLTFLLSSEPHEEDADILSLLLVGKTTGELNEDLSQRIVGATKSTEQLLAEILSGALEKNIKDATGLDLFTISTGAQNADNSSDAIKITVGKNISPRLSTNYSIETERNEAVQQATVEYRIIENILLKTFNDSRGNFGGEVQCNFEFR